MKNNSTIKPKEFITDLLFKACDDCHITFPCEEQKIGFADAFYEIYKKNKEGNHAI